MNYRVFNEQLQNVLQHNLPAPDPKLQQEASDLEAGFQRSPYLRNTLVKLGEKKKKGRRLEFLIEATGWPIYPEIAGEDIAEELNRIWQECICTYAWKPFERHFAQVSAQEVVFEGLYLDLEPLAYIRGRGWSGAPYYITLRIVVILPGNPSDSKDA